MYRNDRLDQLLEQLAKAEVRPPAALQQTVRKRIRRRHQLIQWMVIFSLLLNGAVFVGLMAVPWLPGFTPLSRVVILLVESVIGSAVILALLAARDLVGRTLSRLELLVIPK